MKRIESILDAVFTPVIYGLIIILFIGAGCIAVQVVMGASRVIEMLLLASTGVAVSCLYIYLKSKAVTND